MIDYGEPVTLELRSADLSTAGTINIRSAGSNGTVNARPLAANERLIICSLFATQIGASISLFVFDDVNTNGNVDSGELLLVMNPSNIGGISQITCIGGPDNGVACGQGRAPKVKASAAGQTDIVGVGYIIKS